MQDELIALLAGRSGHFRMESGYHSERWFDLGATLAQEQRLEPFVAELARRLAKHRVDAVCGPMTGGAKLARKVADQLGAGYFFTARIEPADAEGLYQVRYRLPEPDRTRARGKTFAVVDDAISAGSAVRGTEADIIACGGKVAGFGALFVFGDAARKYTASRGLGLEAIAEMEFGMWLPADCPLCRKNVPLERVSDA